MDQERDKLGSSGDDTRDEDKLSATRTEIEKDASDESEQLKTQIEETRAQMGDTPLIKFRKGSAFPIYRNKFPNMSVMSWILQKKRSMTQP